MVSILILELGDITGVGTLWFEILLWQQESIHQLYHQRLMNYIGMSCWRGEVTGLRKEKQGVVIALSLKKGDKDQIRESV